ncbi:MAG: Eco57I restriction-modification methylase domain-containing protein [Eubacteriales bacterium]|nr:Eco57I restriction-modification methylase domain-containing protein [Eubacteriales bacterium]
MDTEKKIAFKSAFDYKVIYAFTVDDDKHRGLIKIGDATLHSDEAVDKLPPNCRALNQAALARIKEYTNTVGVTPNLLHTELAVKTVKGKDGSFSLKAFRDHEVHKVLENSGIKKAKIDDTTGREWYRIDKETAIEAIVAVKKNFANLSNSTVTEFIPIVFRPEQKEAIERTVKQFKKGDRMLWNAKMRFGKTLSALEVIRQCGYKKSIILTHRPVVNEGWYEDFTKIFHGTGYRYGAKSKGYTVEDLVKTNGSFIYFASIQDLRGSEVVGGKFGKNKDIFDTIWDCVIVDEAHEGTKTALGDDTIKAIVKEDLHKTKLLALSGTPFNIMDEYDDDSIYTWDYIMEQENKSEWDKLHFGDSNPYDELPELRIYTYDLGDLLHNGNYITYEDKAFNFHEFFRTWTGDFKADYAQMPDTANIGDFVHEQDIWSFLNLMTKSDDKSAYPFSREEYRDLFRHSLWMVPGVREAKALKALMGKHPVFGNGQFEIVNVAGSDDEESADALNSVRKAIAKAEKVDTYTITLSCGKLTTGVTVKEWTAVFMLSGSFSTSAANYLQTIFRVQSPCNKNGKIKETAYVFDFAPDRTLKMISEAVSVSRKAGKTNDGDRKILGKFLNYCPVISIAGSQMKEYKADKLLQQLKKAYADKVVRNGFDDTNLYNDELFKLQDLDLKKFEDLKKIIGKSKAAEKPKDIDVNKQGLTDEEYEEQEKLDKKKKKKELTEEEKARLEELKKKKANRNNAISILRGISIRMPLLIYGADIPYDEEITLDRFVEQVDDSSWDEFMPTGVTKAVFAEFRKYYDEDVFIAAGRRIRNIAREADTLNPTDRVKKIAGLFAYFKNPDKETVLTPWRVVNMHMADCLGGYDFFDEEHKETLDAPRFVDKGQVTADTFANPEAQILEINSKTGLYPLYVAYSLYRARRKTLSLNYEITLETERDIWRATVEQNVFVICKTPMAKQITKRTLVGFDNAKVNAHCFDDLINQMKNKQQQFADRVLKPRLWKKERNLKMKFDAIVGNPPYQEMDGGNRNSSSPVYQYFVQQSKSLAPGYISMITPSRWFAGGKGLDDYRAEMLADKRIRKIIDYVDSNECFKGVDIAGGISYFLWDSNYNGLCNFTSVRGADINSMERKLDEYDILIRNNISVKLLERITNSEDEKMDRYVFSRNVFGISTTEHGQKKKDTSHQLTLVCSQKGNQLDLAYVSRDIVQKNQELIDKYKVVIGRSVPRNGEVGVDPSVGYRAITTVHIFGRNTVFTDTYLLLSYFDTQEEAIHFAKYMTMKLPRFLLHETYSSMAISKENFRFVPYLDYSREWSDGDLYARYECTEKEQTMIESMMRPLEYVVH